MRLQQKLGKQIFHEKIKKLLEHFTDTIKDTSLDITETITESSFKNNEALDILNNKLLQM